MANCPKHLGDDCFICKGTTNVPEVAAAAFRLHGWRGLVDLDFVQFDKIEYKPLDPKFPPGPWTDEPSLATWKAFKLPCKVTRNPETGGLCGYTSVPEEHLVYGKDPDEEFPNLRVHGGVTFSNFEADKLYFTVGFDCGHAMDVLPMMIMHNVESMPGSAYRDFSYVVTEVLSLARQLHELTKPS
jgi:hypothetical protein